MCVRAKHALTRVVHAVASERRNGGFKNEDKFLVVRPVRKGGNAVILLVKSLEILESMGSRPIGLQYSLLFW